MLPYYLVIGNSKVAFFQNMAKGLVTDVVSGSIGGVRKLTAGTVGVGLQVTKTVVSTGASVSKTVVRTGSTGLKNSFHQVQKLSTLVTKKKSEQDLFVDDEKNENEKQTPNYNI